MKKLLNKLHDHFVPAYYHSDEQLHRKARILVNTSFITTFFAISFFFLASLFGQFIPAIGLVFCSFIFVSLPWLLKRGVPRAVCANIFIATAFFSCLLDIYWYK